MNLPFRLCALDLDETTLSPDHTLSEPNRQAIRAVHALGVQVVLASGRMHVSMQDFAAQLGLDGPLISYNGAMVRHLVTNAVWLHEQIAPPIAAELMDYAREHDLQLNFYANDLLYSQAETHWLGLYRERTNAPIVVRPDLYDAFREMAPTKLLIVDTPDTITRLCAEFKERYAGRLYVTISSSEYVEFMPIEANKGRALAAIAGHLGISPAETLAFGDSLNDIPMLEWAGTGIAVANARPEVLAIADRVVGHYTENAVGVTLREIFGLATPGHE